MATNIETMWVTSQEQLDSTVQTLLGQGGQVQGQADGEVHIYLKKKMNIVVLVVGLILCLVPGLVYLLWYTTSDQNQQITVKIGSPTSIHTEHEHWYDQQAVDGASPGTVPPEVPAAPADPALGAPPAAAVPPAQPAMPGPPPSVPPAPPTAPGPPPTDLPPAPPAV